jgi:hypothetical protein
LIPRRPEEDQQSDAKRRFISLGYKDRRQVQPSHCLGAGLPVFHMK